MASYEDCLLAIVGKEAEGAITKDQAEEILMAIDELAKKKKVDGTLGTLDQTILKDVGQLASEVKVAALVEKRNALINHAIRKKAIFQVNQFKNQGEGLLAYLVGSVKSKFGSKFSVDAQIHALQSEFTGKLVNGLEEEDLLPAFASGKLDEEIARELWNMPGGAKPVTNSLEAFKIAKLINSLQVELVARQNRAGAWIHLMPGYVVKQSHDMTKIRGVSKQAWIDYILPKLDASATFGDLSPDRYADFLGGAYDGLATGIHYRSAGGVEQDSSYTLLGFKGPKNLAKKVSQERVLHFKDADAWMEYHDTFGYGSIREAVVSGLDHGARNLGLMQALGTNPKAMVERLLSDLRAANKGNPAAIDAISDIKVMNRFKELDGTTNIPDDPTVASIGRGIRVVQNMSKLGGALISSITDLPTQVAELRYQGVPLMQAWFNSFWNPIRGRGVSHERGVAQLLGVGFDGLIGNVVSRFDASDNVPGTMSKLQQRFFKLNGMNYWNDAHMTGVTLMSSHHLASSLIDPKGVVGKELDNLFSQYAILPADYPLLRKAIADVDGTKYLLPDELSNVGDSLIWSRISREGANTKSDFSPAQLRKIRDYRDELKLKLRTLFSDRARTAIPHPGAAERAMMNQGTQPGTILGEAIRLFMQFKSFPIAVVRKAIGREIYGSGADTLKEALLQGKGDILGLAHFIATTTLFGYAAMSLKDLAKGREPRDPTDPKVMAAAMTQGGGLGIYGDFLFGEFSRYGRSFTATMAGPTFGQLDDLAEIYTRVRTGEDALPQSIRMAINNTPFMNLFYTRSAMDYLILYQLQEAVAPGYLHRMEARIRRENNQEFYLPPSSVVPYGGGDVPFESLMQ